MHSVGFEHNQEPHQRPARRKSAKAGVEEQAAGSAVEWAAEKVAMLEWVEMGEGKAKAAWWVVARAATGAPEATVVGWEAGSPAVEEAGKAAAMVMAAHSRLGSALGLWPMQQHCTQGSSSS